MNSKNIIIISATIATISFIFRFINDIKSLTEHRWTFIYIPLRMLDLGLTILTTRLDTPKYLSLWNNKGRKFPTVLECFANVIIFHHSQTIKDIYIKLSPTSTFPF